MRLIDADKAICVARLSEFPAFARGTADITDLSEFLDDCETVVIPSLCNDPLTLEELRTMDGEPVWVVSPDNTFESCWMLVMVENGFVMANWQVCDFKTYGKFWLAYRRKPEEADTP